MKTGLVFFMVIAFAAAAGAGLIYYENEAQYMFALWGQEVTWVNFDYLPNGTPLATGAPLTGLEWASQHVVFSSAGNTLATAAPGIGGASSRPNTLAVVNSGSPYDSLLITFTDPAVAAGLTFIGPDFADQGDRIIVRATDGTIMAEMPMSYAGMATPGIDIGFFAGFISDTPIGSIEFLRIASEGDPIRYDNLIFQPVPEPAAMLILAVGAVGLALRGRRKMQR